VDGDARIGEEELKSLLLVDGVTESLAERAFGQHVGAQGLRPREEVVDDGPTSLFS